MPSKPEAGLPLRWLGATNHDRDAVGLTYVYPVVSRRAAGVSVGINLNPNQACNWGCVYCQVPGLTRGSAPTIDLQQLNDELRWMLDQIVNGDFMQQHVPGDSRRLNDIAFSGNGEPTSASCFLQAVDMVGKLIDSFALSGKIKLILITNGSLVARPAVQQALQRMAALNGEVWFKFDRGLSRDFLQVNQVHLSPKIHLHHLAQAAVLCPTWVQSCFFAWDGQLPDDVSVAAYLDALRQTQERGVPLQGVLLYGLARPSQQPQAHRLSPAPVQWMQQLAESIQALGLAVKLSA